MLNQKIHPLSSGLILGCSVVVISLILYFVYSLSVPLINESIKQNRLSEFNYFISSENYDNDLLEDAIIYKDLKLYPAIKKGKIQVLFVESVTKNGYSGDIHLLTVLDQFSNQTNPRVLGVSVLSHVETPGLGDKIERRKSTWIVQFEQKEYQSDSKWQLKKDGGEFDSITGSTITSRAVINEIKRVINEIASIKVNQIIAK